MPSTAASAATPKATTALNSEAQEGRLHRNVPQWVILVELGAGLATGRLEGVLAACFRLRWGG